MPPEATKACSLYLLPQTPTQAALEIGYATRGAQVVACDAARALAVQTHAAEHALEDQVSPKGRQPSR
jgi:phage terminase small subunit